jgi:Holliday junction resolvasome RuvABC endonuclease subunit
MKIIAFDLGKNFAWAHNLPGKGKFKAEHVILKGDSRAHRLGNLIHRLTHIFETSWPKFDIVIYETPFARGRDATRSLWGIAGIIEACASNASLPVVDAAVPTIKKFATGHGKGDKSLMIAAAKKFGYKGDNEHEADAVCLLKYAEANLERVVE